jgi:hypothetical protein
MKIGLYLLRIRTRVWRIVSEDSSELPKSFLLIARTGHIFTELKALVVPDTYRVFQHIAKFYNGPSQVADFYRYSYGRRSPGLKFRASQTEVH